MKGTIFKETEKLSMGWSKLICLGIVFLWKLCEVEKIQVFTRKVHNPLAVELFRSKEGAEYIKTLDTIHFSKIIQEKKPLTTSYNENSEQTKWRKMLSLQGVLQEIIKELKNKGIKV